MQASADRRRTAFTLTELLVVVAIIGILAALLLSAMHRARLTADAALCRTNLRQICMAQATYLLDFYCYPPDSSVDPRSYRWYEYLGNYTRAQWGTNLYRGVATAESKLYLCPGYARVCSKAGLSTTPAVFRPFDWGCYGYNTEGIGRPWDGLGLAGHLPRLAPLVAFRPTRNVFKPSSMITVGDSEIRSVWAYDPDPVLGWASGSVTFWQYFGTASSLVPRQHRMEYAAMQMRHQGYWNVGFCDGHIEPLFTRNLLNFLDDEVLKRWNGDYLPHEDLVDPLP